MTTMVSRIGAALTLAGALLLEPAFASLPEWVQGTATETAHDKQIAHDLAFDQAKRNAERTCDGSFGGTVELRAVYQFLAESSEWSATVTIRETCLIDSGDDR